MLCIPFPTHWFRRYRQPEYAQPFAPLGIPFPSAQQGYTYIPSQSPGPGVDHHYRPRTRSHSSAQHHHRSRSNSHGHHNHSSTDQGHYHSSHSHSRTRTHSHSHHGHSHSHSALPNSHGGRSHSHSRPRFPSATPAPPVLVTHHSDPFAGYGAQPQSSYAHQYGPAQVQYGRSAPSNAWPQSAPSAHAPRYPQPQTNVVQMPRRIHFNPHGPTLLSHEITSTQEYAQPPRAHKHSMTHPLFHYSRCTGKKKALCIGINYTGTSNALQGCVNDAKNMYHFLTEHHNYPKSAVVYLADTSHDPRTHPTRDNILNAMRWLVQDAHEDDSLFLHYSGHGGQVRDLDGDEVDGYDEVIFPLDYKTKGVITDDLMHEILASSFGFEHIYLGAERLGQVSPLPAGCRLTGLFDSCHSGSILDLPYLYHSNGRVKGSQVARNFRKERSTPADVITWSGSTDSQTSADTVQGGQAVGAMSYAFVKVLKRNPQISYQDLLRGVREVLKSKYSQKPQLSSSHRIDTNLRFII
ncbi:caspase domain-containing protein [Amylostereum chailletii]|nr:caspase domain-containing protein [Amylostereum chailletii]